MVAVRLEAIIGEDRKLVIQLPPEIPVGLVELVVQAKEPSQQSEQGIINPAREAARLKLMAAGALSTAHHPKYPIVAPTEEEIRQAGILSPNARRSEDILREMRDED